MRLCNLRRSFIGMCSVLAGVLVSQNGKVQRRGQRIRGTQRNHMGGGEKSVPLDGLEAWSWSPSFQLASHRIVSHHSVGLPSRLLTQLSHDRNPLTSHIDPVDRGAFAQPRSIAALHGELRCPEPIRLFLHQLLYGPYSVEDQSDKFSPTNYFFPHSAIHTYDINRCWNNSFPAIGIPAIGRSLEPCEDQPNI